MQKRGCGYTDVYYEICMLKMRVEDTSGGYKQRAMGINNEWWVQTIGGGYKP